MSPGFVDSIFVPLYEQSTLIKSRTKLHSFVDIMNPGNGISMEKHVVPETTLDQGSNQSSEEELDLLKLELRKCHQKILHNTSYLVLVDEFSNLLSQYCNIKKQAEKHRKENMLVLPKELDALENSSLNHPIKDSIHLKSQDTIAETLAINNMFYNHSDKAFRIQNRDYLLTTMIDVSNSQLSTIEIFDIKTQQPLAKSIKIFEKEVEKMLAYAASLNMLITQSNRIKAGIILKLYRTSPKGLKRVAEIPFNTFTSRDPSIMNSEFEVELLEPEHIFACFASQTLILVNILARKIVKTHTYREDIEGIRYIRALKLLVIICKNQLFVYDFNFRLVLSNPRFSIKHESKNVLFTEIYSTANVVVICKQRSNTRKRILRHKSEYTFIVFEINQSDVNVYQATIELADVINDKLTVSALKIEAVVIDLVLGKFYVYYKSNTVEPGFLGLYYRGFEMRKRVTYKESALCVEKSSAQRKKLKEIIKSFEKGE